MQPYGQRAADATKILTRRELAGVLVDLNRKASRSKNTRLNLVLFRLACCCGLRASEIAQLRLDDVRVDLERPHLRIRRGAAKGGRPRIVPLWWEADTLCDLRQWREQRLQAGATPRAPFVASLRPDRATQYPDNRSRGTPYANGSARPARYSVPIAWRP